MDAGTIKLLEFLYSPKSVFRIPVYQRRYEWTEAQVEQYFEDIEDIALNEDMQGHFLGTVVFVKASFPGMGSDYIIIDGQQRITTTFLMLKALQDAIEDENTKEDIRETYFENRNVEEAYKYKLLSVEDDRKDFLELIVHNVSTKTSKIHMNYKYLRTLILHSSASPMALYEALQKLKIVYIQLEQGKKDENPQVIFESLNSTGLSLTESDLIRNFLLMNEEPEVQKNLYYHYWLRMEELLTNAKISDYIRDYLTMKTSTIPNKSKVYESFKQYMFTENLTSEILLKDLLKFARHYSILLNPEGMDRDIQHYLTSVLQLKSTVTYPYLLRLLNLYEEQRITKQQLMAILQTLTAYLIRRLIVNFPTNALNKVFSTLVKVTSETEGKTEEQVVNSFLGSRTGTALFPRDNKVRESILTNDIYNRNPRLTKMILSQIEQNMHKETVDFEEVTIEHIMPQTLTPGWRNTLGRSAADDHKLYGDVLGNLTLTAYNSNLSNKLFEEKKEIYAVSNIKITRDLREYPSWDKTTILARGEELVQQILQLWPIPQEAQSLDEPQAIMSDNYYAVFEPLEVTGRKPKSIKIDEKEYPVDTWKKMLVTYLEWLADYDLERYLALPKQKSFQKLLNYSKDTFRLPLEVTGIWVETNLSAHAIYNFISALAEHYGKEETVFVKMAN